MTLELNERERGALAELIERRLHDLVTEISRTEAFDYKARLKEERTLLEQLQRQFAASSVAN